MDTEEIIAYVIFFICVLIVTIGSIVLCVNHANEEKSIHEQAIAKCYPYQELWFHVDENNNNVMAACATPDGGIELK